MTTLRGLVLYASSATATATATAPSSSWGAPTMGLKSRASVVLVVFPLLLLCNESEALVQVPLASTHRSPLQGGTVTRTTPSSPSRSCGGGFVVNHVSSSSTILCMGLRSFIGRIKRKKDDDDNEYDDDDTTPNGSEISNPLDDMGGGLTMDSLEREAGALGGEASDGVNGSGSVTTDAWKPSMRPDPRPPVRMGEDPSSKEIDVFSMDRAESVQERINRVKSGKMTDEEKEAYLRAALSSGSTPESRLPLRPPTSKAEQETLERHFKASPFPGDPIYRSIAGYKDTAPGTLPNELVDRVGLDMQKRKRDYLDMVTDPHRFDVYRSAASKTGQDQRGIVSGSSLDDLIQGRRNDRHVDNDTLYGESAEEVAAKPAIDPLPADLGERLGAAAIAQEASRIQAEEESRKKELEERRRREVFNSNRVGGGDISRQNAAAARFQDKNKNRPVPAKQSHFEQERMEELMKAQDDYWARKLVSERQATERQLKLENQKFTLPTPPPSRSRDTVSRAHIKLSQPPPPPQESVTETPDQTVPTPQVDGGSGPTNTFNPDESDLLNGESGDTQLGGRTNDRSSVQPFSPSDLNDVRSLNRPPAYGAPPPRRPAKDNNVDDQIRRLRELNSPLPNRAPQKNFAKGSRSQPPGPAPFEPQRPVTATSRPADRSSSFNNLMKNNLNDSRDPAAKTRTLLNGFSGKSDASESGEEPKENSPAKSTIPASFTSDSAQDKSKAAEGLNPISMLFGATPPKRPNDNETKSEPKEKPAQAPPPRRKGPIRMQLPLVDGEDDDSLDSGANPGMSIAEAMKRTNSGGGTKTDQGERSKKWGVDMSKFT